MGYHTGTDFEIFPEELSADIPVRAICSGNLALREWASGYGGVAVQNCELAGSPITVVYGHLKLESIASGNLKIGDRVGILGADHSAETDGERKHLHLGIHKGTVTNIAGYVVDQANLTAWLDPCSLVCQN
ncbi:peptidoglycan DD-metalloendopeptidase family protein [Candidatus Microgenomates bacterium]|nr:peptidoglycan DD-metalloendopeptidase family protein [Candidatus Microgenomates bacterium]